MKTATIALPVALALLSMAAPVLEQGSPCVNVHDDNALPSTPATSNFKLKVTYFAAADGQCASTDPVRAAVDCSLGIQVKVTYADGRPVDCPKLPNGTIDFKKVKNDPQYADCKLWHGEAASDMCPKWTLADTPPSAPPADGESEKRFTQTKPCATANDVTKITLTATSCDMTNSVGGTINFKCVGDCP